MQEYQFYSNACFLKAYTWITLFEKGFLTQRIHQTAREGRVVERASMTQQMSLHGVSVKFCFLFRSDLHAGIIHL